MRKTGRADPDRADDDLRHDHEWFDGLLIFLAAAGIDVPRDFQPSMPLARRRPSLTMPADMHLCVTNRDGIAIRRHSASGVDLMCGRGPVPR